MALHLSSLASGTLPKKPVHRAILPTAHLQCEELEKRIVQDASMHGRIIPDGLLDTALVREWDAGHVASNAAAQTVRSIQSGIAQITMELNSDQLAVTHANDGLAVANQTLTVQLDGQKIELADLEKQAALSAVTAQPRILDLQGEQEASGESVKMILEKGFLVRATVTPNALRFGIIAAQYDSSTGEMIDSTFTLAMVGNGGILFCVYQDIQGSQMQGGTTADGVLKTGVPQVIEASFDPKTQEITLRVDGVTIPLSRDYTGKVTHFKGGHTPVHVGWLPKENGRKVGLFPGRIEGAILSDLQPQSAAAVPAIAPATIQAKKREMSSTQAKIDVLNGKIVTAEREIKELTGKLTATNGKTRETEAALAAAKTVVSTCTAKRDALLTVFASATAEVAEDQRGLRALQNDLTTASLLETNARLSAEAKDLAMTDFLAGHTQATVVRTQDVMREKAPSPSYAPVREGFVDVQTSVTVTKTGDTLELRTKYFDGKQSFRLGDTVITPEKGDHVMTIPLWAAPEEIRSNPEAIQTMIDRQMTWNSVSAPATASGDIFKPSSLGTWTVEVLSANGTSTRLSPQTLTPNIAGIAGLRGSAPDGMTGKELIGAAPRIVCRPVGDSDEVRFELENMPAGYTLQIEQGKPWEGHRIIYKRPITPGNFSRVVNTEGRFLHWTILGPSGEFIDDRVFDPYREVAWPLPMIQLPVTKDLPLMVGVNETDAPLSIAADTDPLSKGALLVRPTAGKDVRLSLDRKSV